MFQLSISFNKKKTEYTRKIGKYFRRHTNNKMGETSQIGEIQLKNNKLIEK